VSGEVWKTVETKARKGKVAKVEGGRSKEKSRKKAREKGDREKMEEEKNKDNRYKEGSRKRRNLGQEERSCEVRERSEETGSRKVSQVDKSVWQEAVRANAHQKSIELCYRYERRICAEKEKGVSLV